MQRRKLLLGLGTTAGAAGAVGSGAFTSTSAQRDVTVQVADDATGYLSLGAGSGPNADAFTEVSGGTVALDFSSTGAGGSGLGTSSNYQFDDLLRVRNQGTQRVFVFARLSGGVSNDELYFYPESDPSTQLRDEADAVLPLDPGEESSLGVFVDTDTLDSDATATTTFTATDTKPAASIQGGRGSVLVSKDTGRGEFSSIQAAVDDIEAGNTDATTIEIDSGSFGGSGPIQVNDPNGLQFRGSGSGTDGTNIQSRLQLSGGSPVEGVVVRNLRITGVSEGPAVGIGEDAEIVENAVVDNVAVVGNPGTGIGVNPARNFELRNSVIENNGGTGVDLGGPGVGGTTLSVVDSRIEANGGEGVSAFADSFERVSVIGSAVAGNGGTGLFVGTAFASELRPNAGGSIDTAELIGVSAADNGGAGVLVSGDTLSRVTLEDVAATGNTTNGIDLNGVSVIGGSISQVTVAGNGGTGVALGSFAPDAVVTGSLDRALVEDNGDASDSLGVDNDSSGVAVFDGVGNVGTNVTVSDSNVVDNADFGVRTDDAPEGVIEVQLSNVFLGENENATSNGVSGSSVSEPVPGVGADAD